MTPKEPTAFKYKSDGSSNSTLVVVLITSTIISIIGIANFSCWFAWGLLLPLGIAIYLARAAAAKNLIIGYRYIIAGDAIIYYTTVVKAQLDRQRQVLTLFSGRGKRLMIEAERFPTNARKDFKIKANRTAKFNKAVEKILARLSGVTPEIID